MRQSQELQQAVNYLLDKCHFTSDRRKFLLDFAVLLYGLRTEQITITELSVENLEMAVYKIWSEVLNLSQLVYPYDKPFANLDDQSFIAIRNCLTFVYGNKITLAEMSTDFFNSMLECMNQSQLIHAFITPVSLAELMADMLSPEEGESVLDPCCGSGRLLSAAFSCNRTIAVSGGDSDESILAIAFFNLYFNGCTKNVLRCIDFFKLPIEDERFYPDVILSNPPYKDNALSTAAFVDRIIEILKPGGRCGILVPEGFLTHTASTKVVNMRKRLLSENCVQAVVSLPMKIYKPYTESSSSLIILKKERPDRKHRVFFSRLPEYTGTDVDFSDAVYREDIQKITAVWTQYRMGRAVSDDLCWTADLDAIKMQEYILAADGYRHSIYLAPQIQLERIQRDIKIKQQALNELFSHLFQEGE